MASEILMAKTPTGLLMPVDDAARIFLDGCKTGWGVKLQAAKVRSIQFHRKAFALFKLAYEAWEPEPVFYKGQPVAKNFDRFRKDLTVLSGFYTATVNLRGETRLEPESLRFASMSAERFEQVYKAVLDEVWRRVLCRHGYGSPEAVDRIVEELLRFE